MIACRYLLLFILFALSSAALAGDRSGITLSHFEPVERLDMRGSDGAGLQKPGAVGSIRMSFDVLGRSFELELEPNARLLAAVPQILYSGLVQEGAKMVPIVVWWWRCGRNISPKLGLAIGAAAGAGFGIFEAVWAHGRILAAGWTLQAIQTDGFIGIAGFWERFFAIGFHISASALAGYGLARGKGWQFYLIAGVLHALLNYSVVFLQKGYFTIVQLETYAAVFTVILTAVVLLLRWRRTQEEEIIEIDV